MAGMREDARTPEPLLFWKSALVHNLLETSSTSGRLLPLSYF